MFGWISSNSWFNRIPFENPWVTSFIAGLIGSVAMTLLGIVLALFNGELATSSPGSFIVNGLICFIVIFVICVAACMLEFS